MATKQASVDLKQALKKYFGFSQFKGNQEEIIQNLLNQEDIFVLMPTGGGKSLCYQLPAILSDGVAIIVSPLIALMKNQVDAIRGISQENNIAHVLNSSLNKTEEQKVRDDVVTGKTKMLYISPESLTKEENQDFFRQVKISFFAIDEAHCISEWGHDFRPDYRNLNETMNAIGKAPVIALTATATPKVQEDIQKSLGMSNAKIFKASFNRPNLFYEVRPKINTDKQIVKFVKEREGKSGIIYCLSRKQVEECAQLLQINGLKAIPYHAGLDSKTRAKHQDMFLMQDADVVVATIAFGMGIDKPDVRFVIHYDMPKSLESYYQETGRAGRDGGEGYCLGFYDYKDLEKFEKFLASKPIAEREVGMQLLGEVMAYSETAMSRRKYLLRYFGEEFDEKNGLGADMDDNMRNPKKQLNTIKEAQFIVNIIKKTKEKLKIKDITNIVLGKESATIKSYGIEKEDFFGKGQHKEEHFWKSMQHQLIIQGFINKEIESYGILKLKPKYQELFAKNAEFWMAENTNFKELLEQGNNQATASSAFDTKLLKLLTDLRKKVAKKHQIPPYAVFQDPSLNDMTVIYPTNIQELAKVYGVGEGKAKKFGKEFVKLIDQYVEDNNIERPDDLVIKQVANQANHKVYVIQSVDRKLNLEEVADNKGLSMQELIKEMESIVYQGTKLNIAYYVDEVLDEDQQEEIHDYLMEADSDSIKGMLEEFQDEYDEEDLRLMRIKFISEIAN